VGWSLKACLQVCELSRDISWRYFSFENYRHPYHRLRRAVAYVNGGKFRVKTEAEQQIWNECSRLITNAMIYYNTALLSRVYEQKRAAGDREAMAGISPVAWQSASRSRG
jgi:TnpA family transposase